MAGLRRSPRMVVGLCIVLFFVLVALYGAFFIHDGNALSNNILKAPSAHDWLGTTQSDKTCSPSSSRPPDRRCSWDSPRDS